MFFTKRKASLHARSACDEASTLLFFLEKVHMESGKETEIIRQGGSRNHVKLNHGLRVGKLTWGKLRVHFPPWRTLERLYIGVHCFLYKRIYIYIYICELGSTYTWCNFIEVNNYDCKKQIWNSTIVAVWVVWEVHGTRV